MVAAQDGDVPLLQPGDYRWVEPSRSAPFGSAAEPWSKRHPAGPHARAYEERIASRHLNPRFFLPCFQILHIDGGARFQVRDAFEARNVDQDAARKDAVLEVVNGVFCVALFH